MISIYSAGAGAGPLRALDVRDAPAADAASDSAQADAARKRRENDKWLTSDDFAPDMPNDVDAKEADGAFARLLQKLFSINSGLAANALRPQGHHGAQDLASLEQLDPSTMAMMASMITMEALGDTAKSTQRALELLAERQDKLRQEDIQKFREQMDKATEDANKARKGGVFSAVFDWIVAAVETVVGAVKVVTGVLTMNPLLIAGGVADLGAGIAGLGAAFHKTMALVDPKNAGYHEQQAEKWGKAQMAFQIIGAVVGFGTSLKGVLAARTVTKTAGRVFKGAAGESLEHAIKAGDKAAIDTIKKRVSSEVSFVIGDQIGKRVGKSLLQSGTRTSRALAKAGFNRMAETFAQQMTEQMVERAFKKVVKAATKQVAKGKAVTAKSLGNSFGSQLRLEAGRAALRGSWSLSGAVRSTLVGANAVGQNVIGMQRAKLNFDARNLGVDMMWLQTLMDLTGDDKKRNAKRMETLIEQQADIATSASEMVQQTGATRIRIAASMA
ncbi:Secreted effector protein SseC [Pandoraea iniqua]|uniref:Secreted effector protein SseC n=1 Tax=Pandoraea iniqua TaxID=2508288 RepID=A0A5E4RD88_9BURK|nr:type III secretion system translocon subunit SctE [Pandoraea iniqua]VVD59998.1 Secreted effector protein SseC [Pandoraea iniqua]